MAAILMYESALGLGISAGPLVGAVLGNMSWRYPFFGTATLMAVGFIAISLFLGKTPKPAKKIGLADPIVALKHKGLLTTATSAFFYNYAFFTVLAFVPFVLDMSAYTVGGIFFGWGVLLALFSVVVAPRLQSRFPGPRPDLDHAPRLALLLVAIAFGPRATVIAAVVLAGAVMGINNTVYTEMALEVSERERPVASAGYNFVRWFAGVVAPFRCAEDRRIRRPGDELPHRGRVGPPGDRRAAGRPAASRPVRAGRTPRRSPRRSPPLPPEPPDRRSGVAGRAGKHRRIDPHRGQDAVVFPGEVAVEDELVMRRAGQPAVAGDLVLQLARRPARIAEHHRGALRSLVRRRSPSGCRSWRSGRGRC